MKTKQPKITATVRMDQSIFLIRGQKVMLSNHLAGIYAVEHRVLVQAVKRNIERFPGDFMFQLTREEAECSRSQIVILNEATKRGQNLKYLPYAFTQEGIAMLSSVLHSPRAIEANIAIMRAFVKLRELMHSNHELAEKINALEKRHDAQFKVVFNSIRELIEAQPKAIPNVTKEKRSIGFGRD